MLPLSEGTEYQDSIRLTEKVRPAGVVKNTVFMEQGKITVLEMSPDGQMYDARALHTHSAHASRSSSNGHNSHKLSDGFVANRDPLAIGPSPSLLPRPAIDCQLLCHEAWRSATRSLRPRHWRICSSPAAVADFVRHPWPARFHVSAPAHAFCLNCSAPFSQGMPFTFRCSMEETHDKLRVIFAVTITPTIDGAVFLWDFGDKVLLSAGDSVTHTYQTAGIYSVKLRVEAGGYVCLADVFQANVGPKPTAIVISPVNDERFVAGQTISLLAGDGASEGAGQAASYNWEVQMRHDNHMQYVIGCCV